MNKHESAVKREKIMITGVLDKISMFDKTKGFNLKNIWSIHNNQPCPRYLVEEQPSRAGNMCDIYKAWDIENEQIIAVRMLGNSTQKNDKYSKNIELEAKIMQEISHPSIPKVYGLAYDSPTGIRLSPKMIMEYINEESLQQRLESDDLLMPTEIVEIVSQVGLAIDYFAIQHNLYHGDIKPSQILMTKPNIKITDFGMSTAVSSKGEAYTPEFSAPERQFHGTRNMATEEFSLAATAYNMITGGVINIDIKDLSKPIVKFNKISKINFKYDLNEDDIKRLNEIFEKALATDPEKRYESCSQFAQYFVEIMKKTKGINKSFSHQVRQFAQKLLHT